MSSVDLRGLSFNVRIPLIARSGLNRPEEAIYRHERPLSVGLRGFSVGLSGTSVGLRMPSANLILPHQAENILRGIEKALRYSEIVIF